MAHYQAAPQSRPPAGEAFDYLAMLSNAAGMGIRVCLLPSNRILAQSARHPVPVER